MKIIPLMLVSVAFFSACSKPHRMDQKEYAKDFEEWKKQRTERLKARDGWLNLAGLYWLEPGENSFGSDSGNTIIFPVTAPGFIGTYTVEDDSIFFTAHPGIEISMGGIHVTEIEVRTDMSEHPTFLETGSFAWYVIERGDRLGIRLRDYDHPAVREFLGNQYYKPDTGWIIDARFEAFEEPVEMMFPTVLGTFEPNGCPGTLRFDVNGTEQLLYPVRAAEGFFIVFADETSGNDTYGGGRFLYAGLPDRNGIVHLDFNHAYNPPCAFTPFATCPLPPRENFLSVAVTAGEKFAGH